MSFRIHGLLARASSMKLAIDRLCKTQIKACVIAFYCSILFGISSAVASPDNEQSDKRRYLETNLLPIEMNINVVRLKAPVYIGGGAITSIGETILIMDQRGDFFLPDAKAVKKASVPSLPMNFDAFIGQSAPDDMLVAKDIKYNDKRGSLYASYEAFDVLSKTFHMEIASLSVDKITGNPSSTWEVIFKSPPLKSVHESSVGKIAFDEENIYFCIGKYDPENGKNDPAPQNKSEFLGKTYALNIRTKNLVPLSIGNRVSLGILVNSKGDLWLTENSERGGDKLDLIQPGQNYGWPLDTLGTRYTTYSSSYQSPVRFATGNVAPFTEPVYSWSPSIAPSAIIEIKGFNAAWNGDFLMGSLKAQTLYRIRLRNNHVVMVEPFWIGYRIRDIISVADKIVIWTDDASLLTIQVDQDRLTLNRSIDKDIVASSLRNCVTCHSFDRNQPTDFGPSLLDVYGREIGGDAFAYYSSALRRKGETWDDSSLAAYLSDPDVFAPGTTMRLGDKLNSDQVLEIVALLKELKSKTESAQKQ